MSAEEDVGKAAPLAIGAAAAACAGFLGIGSGICAAGAAIVSALVAFGTWISSAERDTFHPDKATSEAFLTLMRIHPAVGWSADIDRSGTPVDATNLARYFRITSGEVPSGVKGNNAGLPGGDLHNPHLSTACDNPYQCSNDPDEPLTHNMWVQNAFDRYQHWKNDAKGNLDLLANYVGTPHRQPHEAKLILTTIRSYPDPFRYVLTNWPAFSREPLRSELQAQVREMRRLAGESGPADRVLQSLFGGDLTPRGTGAGYVPITEKVGDDSPWARMAKGGVGANDYHNRFSPAKPHNLITAQRGAGWKRMALVGAESEAIEIRGIERTTPEFRDAVNAMAERLDIAPQFLWLIMSFESAQSFDPAKRHPISGAVGLIQFMPSTARAMGTSSDALARMSAVEQLTWVEKFFKPYAGRLKNLEDAYMAVLWPSAVGKGRDFVLWTEGSTEYLQNRGLDTNADGKITVGEAADQVRGMKRAQKGNVVWLIGDSFANGLGPVMAELVSPFGFRGIDGSPIRSWPSIVRTATAGHTAAPGLILASLGTNDAKAARNGDAVKRDAIALIDAARSIGSNIAWILPPSLPFPTYDSIDGLVEATRGIRAFDSSRLDIPRISDGIHPTGKGYRIWARAIVEWMSGRNDGQNDYHNRSGGETRVATGGMIGVVVPFAIIAAMAVRR